MAMMPRATDAPPVEMTRYGRPLYRDPTGNAAVGRASRRSTPTAPVPELRSRLCRAVRNDDGAGALLLAAHLARAAG